jgi:hypothetical protein
MDKKYIKYLTIHPKQVIDLNSNYKVANHVNYKCIQL